jgi:hypothetical protein
LPIDVDDGVLMIVKPLASRWKTKDKR